jgi:hypothetical protein
MEPYREASEKSENQKEPSQGETMMNKNAVLLFITIYNGCTTKALES